MYIKELGMQGFQIHENTTLKFKDGINVIVGPTDNGKSSAYRALKAAFLNNVKLDRKITHDMKKPKCVLEILGEFGTLKRTKSKSTNLYHLNKTELKGSIGQGPVDDVLKFTNITDINFQSQHDKPFLVSASGGEVAKYLNKIIDLEVIDITLSNLKSAEKDATAKVKQYEDAHAEKFEDLAKYKDLEEMSEALEEIEKLEVKIDNGEDIVKLDALVEKLGDALDVLDIFDEANFEKIFDIQSKVKELEALDNKLNGLNTCLEEILISNEEELKSLDTTLMVKQNNEYEQVKGQCTEITCLIKQLSECIEVDAFFTSSLEEMKAELEKISPVCKTCGQRRIN